MFLRTTVVPTHTQVATAITTVFVDARNQIDRDINGIVSNLNKKRAELFAEVNRLEREFVDSYQHKQGELNKLQALQRQTGELSAHTLSTMQHTIAKELELGIGTIRTEIGDSKIPDYKINISWGRSLTSLLSQINTFKLIIDRVGQENTIAPLDSESITPHYLIRRGRSQLQTTEPKKIKYSSSSET